MTFFLYIKYLKDINVFLESVLADIHFCDKGKYFHRNNTYIVNDIVNLILVFH